MDGSAINNLLDRIDWRPTGLPSTVDGSLYATHTGELEIAGFRFRCCQLSDGSRVLDADDVHDFFNTTEVI